MENKEKKIKNEIIRLFMALTAIILSGFLTQTNWKYFLPKGKLSDEKKTMYGSSQRFANTQTDIQNFDHSDRVYKNENNDSPSERPEVAKSSKGLMR